MPSTNNTPGRAIVDHFKYWDNEAINAYLDTRRHNFSFVVQNTLKDVNVAGIVRSFNAFLGNRIIIHGYSKFDKRASLGAYNYVNFRKARFAQDGVPDTISLQKELDDLKREFGAIRKIGIEITNYAKDINSYRFDMNAHTVFFVGHEGEGIPKQVLDILDDCVYIKQFGTCRSLNVSVASAIAMNNYCGQIP